MKMSSREVQIARLVVQGHTNKEIGFRLRLAEGTVKVYLYRLYAKMQLSSRYELIASLTAPAYQPFAQES